MTLPVKGENNCLYISMELISKLDSACVAVTAKGRDYDCVSRVFAPKYGMNEDPVTGSTHCMIATLLEQEAE